MEYASMSEKILRKIESIIKRDSFLQDFTIVPVASNAENRSPVLYENRHFGLESWCVRYVYDYACSKLFQVRKSLAKKKLSSTLEEDLNYLIVGALLINPDVPTFWNMKRELVEDGVLSLDEEITFNRLVLTRKHKSNEAFSYRRWLIDRKLSNMPILPSPESVLLQELSVCTFTAENTPNNYHAWIHRQWVITQFLEYNPGLITTELQIKFWVSQHISENCGYHYRQFLLNNLKLLDCLPYNLVNYNFKKIVWHFKIPYDGEPENFLIYLLGTPAKTNTKRDLSKLSNYVIYLFNEIAYTMTIASMNLVYEPHWLHRRYIVHELLETSYKYIGEEFSSGQNLKNIHLNSIMKNIDCEEKQPKILKKQPCKFKWTTMFRIMSDLEKTFIETSLNAGAVESEHAKKHERWLKYMMKFEVR